MLKAVLLAATLSLGLAAGAQAATPGPMPVAGGIVQVSGGCGAYGVRTPEGFCRPIRPVFQPRLCPRGFHPGPYGRCFPYR